MRKAEMMKSVRVLTRVLIGLLLVLGTGLPPAWATMLPRMRISVENTDAHVQTQAVKRFADDLRRKLNGRIDVQFFANARLFRDRDIVQALVRGQVEMAVPGTWHVTQFEPNVGIFLLPVFYGRDASANHAVADGDIGADINHRIQRNLGLTVIGRWIDLGHAHLFGVKRSIRRHEDLAGLRIRVAGGIANTLRIEAFGGQPAIIPWPDLPEYMQQGRVDAILTSYETIRSARLWEKGVNHVFEDREYFPQYIPLMRESFWKRLTPEIRRLVTATWESHVDAARQASARAQEDAKAELVNHRVSVTIPEPQQIEAWREKLMSRQQRFVQVLGIDPDLVRRVESHFKGRR